MKHKFKTIPISLFVLAGITACTENADMKYVDAVYVDESHIEKFGKSYEIEELVDAWEAAMGKPCDGGVVDVLGGDIKRAACDPQTSLSALPSAEEVKNQLDSEDKRYRENGTIEYRLVGSDWVLNVNEQMLKHYFEELGGVVVVVGETE